MSEGDGVEEAVGGAVRVAGTAAGQVIEQRARERERRAREELERSVAEARQLGGRVDADESVDRALHSVDPDRAEAALRGEPYRPPVVNDPAPGVDQETADYAADAWGDYTAEARQVGARVDADEYGPRREAREDDRVHDRAMREGSGDVFGRDSEWGDRDEQERREELRQRDRRETKTAVAVIGADGARQEWDSTERRADLEERLSATVPDPEAVQARLLADRASATPPTEATRGAGRPTKAKKPPTQAQAEKRRRSR